MVALTQGLERGACMSMLASERFERCIVSVVPGCDTGRGRVILALLSDELYDSVTRISHKVSFPVWPKAFVGGEARCLGHCSLPSSMCLAVPSRETPQRLTVPRSAAFHAPPIQMISHTRDHCPQTNGPQRPQHLHPITPPHPKHRTSSTHTRPPRTTVPSVTRAP